MILSSRASPFTRPGTQESGDEQVGIGISGSRLSEYRARALSPAGMTILPRIAPRIAKPGGLWYTPPKD